MNTTTTEETQPNGKSNGKARTKPLDLSASEPASVDVPVRRIPDGRVSDAFFPDLDINSVHVLDGNPRTRFETVEELAEDIKRRGVLQPILVRVHPTGEGFALVFGERRLRAAKLAGLTTIPALFRDLTDGEALEVQIVENAKRKDIHPLEEADAYIRLRDTHGYTAEEIAARVGKSVATIRQRLTYAHLDKTSREAFFDGKLTAATALVIARMPEAKRAEIAKRIIDEYSEVDKAPCSLYDANDIVERNFMLRLADAPFSRSADMACAAACTTCPKRTGAQTDLFGDLETKDDLCLDKTCFERKVDEDFKAKAAAALEKGSEVLSGKKTAGIFTYGGDLATWGAGADYALASSKEGKAAIKAGGTLVLAQNVRGAAIELVRKAGAKAPKESAKKTKPSTPNASAPKVDDVDLDALATRAAHDAVTAANDLAPKEWDRLFPFLAELLARNSEAMSSHVFLAGLGTILDDGKGFEGLRFGELLGRLLKLSPKDASNLLVAVATFEAVAIGGESAALKVLKDITGVDVDKLEAEMLKAEKAEKAEKAAPKPIDAKASKPKAAPKPEVPSAKKPKASPSKKASKPAKAKLAKPSKAKAKAKAKAK